jgi:hypothetical protein
MPAKLALTPPIVKHEGQQEKNGRLTRLKGANDNGTLRGSNTKAAMSGGPGKMKRSLTLALCLLLPGCGNDSTTNPSATATPTPTPTATPTPSTTSTTVLTITSTVTGNPVAGASVVVAGVAYTTDAAGSITLATPAAPNATVDISAPGYLDRATVVGTASVLTLWQIPTGADANFVRQLVYSRAGTPEVIWRPNAGLISLVLMGDLANDPEVRTAHLRAAAMASAMTDNRVRFELSGSASAFGVVTILVNRDNPGTATTYLNQSGGTILGGRIEYTSMAAARTTRVVAHELGHLLGFGHAPSGLMCPNACGVDTFGPWEHDVFSSMLQRSPGTAPLDNDRALTAR